MMALQTQRRVRLFLFLVLCLAVTGAPAIAADDALQRGLYAYFEQYRYEDAADAFRDAAAGGSLEAMYYLGEMAEGGVAQPQDSGLAARWYGRAAHQGHARAQLRLARLHVTGRGVAQDPALAVHWNREAARRGLPVAQYRLGLLLAAGEGVAVDAVASYKWLTVAASYGEPDALAARRSLWRELDQASRRQGARQAAAWERRHEAGLTDAADP